jgi:hypothetical protein
MPRVRYILALLLLPLAATACDATAGTIRTVAATGLQPPGMPAGTEYSSFNGATINAFGEVAFGANMKLMLGVIGTADDRAVWSEAGGTIRLLARESDPAPGAGLDRVFNSFDTPTLNAAGNVMIGGTFRLGNNDALSGNRAIWIYEQGQLRPVALTGDQAPGAPPGETFNHIGHGVFNRNGDVAVLSRETTGDQYTHRGIWMRPGGGALELVARRGSPAPGIESGVFRDFNSPVLSSNNVAFGATVLDEEEETSPDLVTGLWAAGAHGLRLVALTGDQAPGLAVGTTFDGISEYAVNSSGQTAFWATLEPDYPSQTSNGGGIWSEQFGTLGVVAAAGRSAPGVEPGAVFAGFGPPVINAAGRTAFHAALEIGVGGVESERSAGIWSEGSGSLALVARTGALAPGAGQGVKFEGLHALTINAAGQIAFHGSLAGQGVHGSNDSGIWAQDASGHLHMVVRGGQQIEVAPGDIRTVDHVSLSHSTGNQDGRPSSFNDRGQILIDATFTDGSSGLFVSNFVANFSLTPGDFNQDAVVDDLDLASWRTGFGSSAVGDADGDGDTDGGDFLAWQRGLANRASTRSFSAASATIPEPLARTIALSALACLSRLQRLRPRVMRRD